MHEPIWLQNGGHVVLGHLGVIGFERIKEYGKMVEFGALNVDNVRRM